jgi:hypothetical protein
LPAFLFLEKEKSRIGDSLACFVRQVSFLMPQPERGSGKRVK